MQKYEILSVIGEGAYGVVLKCKDIEGKNFVAVKKFKETDDEEHTKKTTMRQVKILKMANHQNIVQLKQAFRKKGIVYLVFQYLQNNLLQVLQNSRSGLKLSTIRNLMYQLLKGLVYLHSQNIVHRDVKPENLLVGKDNKLKICDFGFARQLKQKEDGLTDYVATRWYRPPELLVGGQYGKQIDIWAVGCIMCQLIDGNPLFPGQNQLDQLFLIQKSFGPLPSDLYQRFIKNPRFLGMKFPQIHNLDKIQKKYFGKICPKGISFIKSLLKMNPKQRLTAAQALEHPYFQLEKNNNVQLHDLTDRKQSQTATTNRKRDSQLISFGDTKYGKIYNKRANAGFDMLTQMYKATNKEIGVSKSVGKQQKKNISNNQNISLQKHRNRQILAKTQMKGFYIQSKDQKGSYGDISKKSTQVGSVPSTTSIQVTHQLPFLLQNKDNGEDTFRRLYMKGKQLKNKNFNATKQIFNMKQSNYYGK